MVIDIGKYRIQPHGGGLCWEVYAFQEAHTGERGRGAGKDIPARYVSLGRYPSTLDAAIKDVCERLAKDAPEHGDARACANAFARMCSTIAVAIREGSSDGA